MELLVLGLLSSACSSGEADDPDAALRNLGQSVALLEERVDGLEARVRDLEAAPPTTVTTTTSSTTTTAAASTTSTSTTTTDASLDALPPEGYVSQLSSVDFPFPGPARLIGEVGVTEQVDEPPYQFIESFSMVVYADGAAVDDVETFLQEVPAKRGWELVEALPPDPSTRSLGSMNWYKSSGIESGMWVTIAFYDASGRDQLRALEEFGVQGPWLEVTVEESGV